jgi:outer membrane autotransporter protein
MNTAAPAHAPASLRSRHARYALLATTALSAAVLALAAPQQASAQEVIDGGATVVVDDPANPWVLGGGLIVGMVGEGALRIETGGWVVNTYGVIGFDPGSSGAVTVTGPGSLWLNTNFLMVGEFGAATLDIADGGEVDNTDGFIGLNAGSTGAVTVTGAGSLWANSQNLTVGFSGSGTLDIADGGEVSNAFGFIGRDVGSSSGATVTGAGSRWTNSEDLFVGYFGSGMLEIADGGEVSDTFAYIGLRAGSIGAATVTGAGSLWANSANLAVGVSGSGTLDIADGGEVRDAWGSIGVESGSTGAVTVTGAGSLWNNSVHLIVGFAGSGALAITDGGEVSNTLGFIGVDIGSTGAVTVTGAGSLWANSQDLTVGFSGAGALAIADGGIVRAGGGAGLVYLTRDAGSFGVLSIGAAAGEAAVGAGTLEAAEVRFGDGAGALVFNHTETAYDFDAVITGTGQIGVLAGVTTLTGDSSAFAGDTTVIGGSLIVNGWLGGQIEVGPAGRIGGSGQIGGLTVGAGAVLAPGNSIGTLNVAGDLTIAAGSVYEVEVDPTGTASDLIAVTGATTINGGTVHHIGLAGAYAPTSSYTILTSAGGVTGTFDAIETDFAFLEASLAYEPDAVLMTLERNDISFAGIGHTFNQTATGAAIEAAGFGTELYGAAVVLNADDARLAFDQLSGELHGSLRSARVEDSAHVRGLLSQRLRETGPDAGGLSMWAQVHGALGRMGADGNAGSLRSRTGGLWLGAEGRVAPGVVLGVAAGADRSTDESTLRGGQAERDGYQLAAYGSGRWGGFGVSGGVAAAWEDLETEREVSFPGFADHLEAAYGAETVQAFAEATWTIPAGPDTLEPFASVARVRTETDGFTETGGAAALTVDGQTQDLTFASLGLGAGHVFDRGAGRTAALRGRIGWRHAWGDLASDNRQAFDVGGAFTVEGLPVEENALLLELGGRLLLRDAVSLNIDWTGQAGDRSTAQRLSATLNWRF